MKNKLMSFLIVIALLMGNALALASEVGDTDDSITFASAISLLTKVDSPESVVEAKELFDCIKSGYNMSKLFATYAAAIIDIHNEDFDGAESKLYVLSMHDGFEENLSEYKIPSLETISMYINARRAESDGHLDDALKLYMQIDFLDSLTRSINIVDRNKEETYAEATRLLNEGEYRAAAEIFSSLGSYKDSKEKAKRASALIPTPTSTPKPTATPKPTPKPTATPKPTSKPTPTTKPTTKPTTRPTATSKATERNSITPQSIGPNEYIFPDSNQTKLTEEMILSVNESLWPYGRNEIFARHGYVFENTLYRTYFESKTWYHSGDFKAKDLNNIEWYNMDLLKSMEQRTSSVNSILQSYIFPNSDRLKLTEQMIRSIDKYWWPYARNEILARHGYVFNTEKYREYFEAKLWYHAGGYSPDDLNDIEWYNMDLLKSIEDSN